MLKFISSLYGPRFGRTNNFTVSGNPISVRLFFLLLSSDFFASIFEQNFLLTIRKTVLDGKSKVMACLYIRFMNFDVYFPQNLYSVIPQHSVFYTTWDTVNNDIVRTALLIHFIPNYVGTFKLGIKCFNFAF